MYLFYKYIENVKCTICRYTFLRIAKREKRRLTFRIISKMMSWVSEQSLKISAMVH